MYNKFIKVLYKLSSLSSSSSFPASFSSLSNNFTSYLHLCPQFTAPEPMDTSANIQLLILSFSTAPALRRVLMASSAQREAYCAQGVYICCGDPSHWVIKCPLKAFQPSPSSPVSVPAPVPVSVPAPIPVSVPVNSPTLNSKFYYLGQTKDYSPINNSDSN